MEKLKEDKKKLEKADKESKKKKSKAEAKSLEKSTKNPAKASKQEKKQGKNAKPKENQERKQEKNQKAGRETGQEATQEARENENLAPHSKTAGIDSTPASRARATKSQKGGFKKSFEVFFITLLLLGITLWLGITFYRAYEPKPQILQGQMQAREYSVSSKLAGRIQGVRVKKGDFVKKGDLIYQIHSPEVEAKLTQAQAGYEAAKALREEADKGARQEAIISAKDVWSSAKAMADLAQKTYERIEELYKNGVVSLQRKDETFAAYQSARYNENAAYQQYKIALEGLRDEAKRAVSEKENAARGQVNEVEAYIKDINAYAPITGEVSNVLLHDGELSPSGFPVVLLVDLQDAWLKLSVSEQYLSRFQKDAVFEGYIPALKLSVRFKVEYVAVMGDFATWRASASSRGYDMKSYEIEARPLSPIEGFRVGMSVLVKVP